MEELVPINGMERKEFGSDAEYLDAVLGELKLTRKAYANACGHLSRITALMTGDEAAEGIESGGEWTQTYFMKQAQGNDVLASWITDGILAKLARMSYNN